MAFSAATPRVSMSQGAVRPTREYRLVEAAMDELNEIEEFDDDAAEVHFNVIYAIYYELKDERLDELQEVCQVMISKGLLDLFAQIWDECYGDVNEFYINTNSYIFNNLKKIKSILQNYVYSCPNLVHANHENDAIVARIMKEFSMSQLHVSCLGDKSSRDIMTNNLAILHNLVRNGNENRQHIRQNQDGLNSILPYTKSSYQLIKTLAFIVLAYCITEKENSTITTGNGVISVLMQLLKSAVVSDDHCATIERQLFSVELTLSSLDRLASNDENKEKIVEAGLLPLLSQLLDIEKNTSAEHAKAVHCLWTLAFHKKTKMKIMDESGLIEKVKQLKKMKSGDEALEKAIKGFFLVLDLEQPVKQIEKIKSVKKHVMISYNWEVQDDMKKLRDYLRSQGIETWMDVDKMHDSMLESMAEAIENSSLVLIAMTESYKNSNSCHTEAEYMYKRKVPFLPLLLQSGYEADGWLGVLIGAKVHVDLTSEKDIVQKFKEVLTRIQKYSDNTVNSLKPADDDPRSVVGDVSDKSDVTDKPSSTTPPFATWTVEQVTKWLEKIGIKDNDDLKQYDGAMLAELGEILVSSPDTYYQLLREDLHFKAKDIVRFTSSIKLLKTIET